MTGGWRRARYIALPNPSLFGSRAVCRWSYFFVDPSPQALAPLAEHPRDAGYELRGYLDPDPEADQPVYFLHVDRVERHTVDSLATRNAELHALAARFGVRDYDGMDVGGIDDPL